MQGWPFPLRQDMETCRRMELAMDNSTAGVSSQHGKGVM